MLLSLAGTFALIFNPFVIIFIKTATVKLIPMAIMNNESYCDTVECKYKISPLLCHVPLLLSWSGAALLSRDFGKAMSRIIEALI